MSFHLNRLPHDQNKYLQDWLAFLNTMAAAEMAEAHTPATLILFRIERQG